MRGLLKLAIGAALAGALALAIVALGSFSSADTRAHAQVGAATMGIDANPEGNSATVLGSREVCIPVRKGDRFSVDVTVEGVSSLVAWEAYLSLDRSVVHVVDRDARLFVASRPDSNVIDVSASVPYDASDAELAYRVGSSDISDPPVGVNGTGVLARITLEAQDAGLTTLSVAPVQTSAGRPVGPFLRDKDGGLTGDNDQDGLFDGPFLDAKVAVDQACPGGEGASLTNIGGGGGGGIASWVFFVAALAVVAAVGLGGVALIRLRRSGSRPAS